MPKRFQAASDIQFLGIGAQKAATSWLWACLRVHPAIWMPPRKELHYFDRHPGYPSPSFLSAGNLGQRLFSRKFTAKYLRSEMRRDVATAVLDREWEAAAWYLRYYLARPTDDWYLSLFRHGHGKVCGEITPAYSILDADDVAGVHRLAPNAQVLFILRNPIDRAWSHLRYAWTRGAISGVDDEATIAAFLSSREQTLRSDYIRALDNWGACYGEDQLRVLYFDDVRAEPLAVLRQVEKWLKIDEFDYTRKTQLGSAVNVSRSAPMPPHIRRQLARFYTPQLRALSDRLGGTVTEWLNSAQDDIDAD